MSPEMSSDVTHAQHGRSVHRRRRDLLRPAALCATVAVAEMTADLVGRDGDGPLLPSACAVLLLGAAGARAWWARRHSHAPPTATAPPAPTASTDRPTPPAPALAAPGTAPTGRTDLWRLRTTVRDTPGSLAALCAALAQRHIDILSLQTHPLAEGTVDEFLLRAPAELSATDLTRAVQAVGGTDTFTERADAHDLVDAPTRALGLALRTALDPTELPLALRRLLGRCTVRSLPPSADRTGVAPGEDALDGTVMHLRAPEGGTITVERPYLPFTPAEFARARALVELDARLGARPGDGTPVPALPHGAPITLRHAGPSDLDAAREMHARCSAHTLRMRYHGPVGDVDRYLTHLLDPRFGHTLAAQTEPGRIVALGHLLWDGDECEVALLVEDAWQGRGIGGELLERLVAMAVEAGSECVYAVTKASNRGVVAAMRGLGLPLDHQIEEGTLVISARLTAPAPAAPAHPPLTEDSSGPSGPSEPAGPRGPAGSGPLDPYEEEPRHHGARS